jgi:hypothetical protein
MDIAVDADFWSTGDKKRSYNQMSKFQRLRSYDLLQLRSKGKDYWNDMGKKTNKHITW